MLPTFNNLTIISLLQKREPVDQEERINDSGIASGSDFISSSPGSEHSDSSHPAYSTSANNLQNGTPYYTTPRIRPSSEQNVPLQRVFDTQDSLTPPISELLASPTLAKMEMQQRTDGEDPLRRLQMTLEKNGFLPSALSPKMSEGSIEDDNKSENELEEFDEQGLRLPKVNSHGKVKTFKCKQCDFVAITKLNFWEHTKSHIKADKLLTCPKCPFVTEYKHHLEYHLRNHFGSKPFKCSQCSYSCVNKSMLNSHLKSHSNIYQYRCAECSYATKYCHSLKLHLRKYNHKPAMVLNPDGSPNPLPIIDIYGTRRGPKIKSHDQKQNISDDNGLKTEPVLPFPLSQLMLGGSPQLQLPFPGFPFFGAFPGAIPNPLLLQNLEKLARERQMSPEIQNDSSMEESEDGVLDLSKPEDLSRTTSLPPPQNGDRSLEEDEEDDGTTTMFDNVETVEEKPKEESTEVKLESNNNKDNFCCQYCKINFGDPVLYTMHMGYHGYNNPFTCNMCGEECNDKVSFFLHIARTQHS